MTTVRRYDVATISSLHKTPQGGYRIPAALTRVGVFPYTRADGTIRKELRCPEEVFKKQSLDSLVAAPVTDLHPPEMVNATNWQQYSNGHVGDTVRADGKFVRAELTISKSSLIEKIDRKEGKELSCGYSCDLDMTSGVWNGERYDCVQRGIVYNHVAVGPENWGRAGSDVSMRLDGKELLQLDSDDAVCRFDEGTVDELKPTNPTGKPTMTTVRIEGIDLESGSTPHIQALEKQKNEAATRADAADTKATEVKSELEKVKGELESEKTRADKAEESLKKFEDGEHLDSLVQERTGLLEDARKLDSEAKYEGMKSGEVMRKALEKTDCKVPEDASDDFVSGMFSSEVKRADEKHPIRPKSSTGSLREAVPRKDDGAKEERKDGRAGFMERSQGAWRNKLAFSKSREA